MRAPPRKHLRGDITQAGKWRSIALGPFSGTKKSCQTKLHSLTIYRPYSQRPGPKAALFVPNVNFAPAAFAIFPNEALGGR